jgi:hypothetical protein
MARVFVAAGLLVLLIFLGSCSDKACEKKEGIINDFEADGDLDRLNWKCRTLFELSGTGVSHGRFALKLTMTPDLYPGVSFQEIPKDWRCYSSLNVSFFNPGKGAVPLTMRIDDKEDDPEYEDRVNMRLTILPGMNRLNIPFKNLVCPSGRRLDTGHVYSLMFFCVRPPETVVLYVDNVRLGF